MDEKIKKPLNVSSTPSSGSLEQQQSEFGDEIVEELGTVMEIGWADDVIKQLARISSVNSKMSLTKYHQGSKVTKHNITSSLLLPNSTNYPINFENNDVYGKRTTTDILNKFIYPVEPLRNIQTGNTEYHHEYDCHILSVHNLPVVEDEPNQIPNTTTPLLSNTPTLHEAQVLEVVGEEHTGSAGVESPLPQSTAGCSSTTKKHRPLKHLNCTMSSGVHEAWVLLGADGNSQQVTERDVNIILGGRSVESALATSPTHQMSAAFATHHARSDTAIELAPIIQESLLFLNRDNNIGEQTEQLRRLKLERKAAYMLLLITQPQATEVDAMQPAPSVHFVNVEDERVLQWRNSQEGPLGPEFKSFVHGRIMTGNQRPTIQKEAMNSISENETTQVNQTDNETTKSNHPIQRKSINIIRKLIPCKSTTHDYDILTMSPTTQLINFGDEVCFARHPTANDVNKFRYGDEKCKHFSDNLDEFYQTKDKNKSMRFLRNLSLNPSNNSCEDHPPNGRKMFIEQEEKILTSNSPTTLHHLPMEMHVECPYCNTQDRDMIKFKEDIQEFKDRLFESENIIKQNIAKHISDKHLEVQLLKAVESYSLNKSECDQKVIQLAQDVLKEHTETINKQRRDLECSIRVLQERNQSLEDENILLLKKLEKLQSRCLKRSGETCETQNSDIASSSFIIKNNEKLRAKLSCIQSRMELMESWQQNMKQKVEQLEVQSRNLKFEAESEKLMKNRLVADHHIECASHEMELRVTNEILQQSLEAANVLLLDMGTLHKMLQNKKISIFINWNSSTASRNTLAEVIHVSRNCINDLGRELLIIHANTAVDAELDKKMHNMNDRLQHMQQVLSEVKHEKTVMQIELEGATSTKLKTEKLMENLVQENAKLQDHLAKAVHKQLILHKEIGENHFCDNPVKLYKEETKQNHDLPLQGFGTRTYEPMFVKNGELSAQQKQENIAAQRENDRVHRRRELNNGTFTIDMPSSSQTEDCRSSIEIEYLRKQLRQVEDEKYSLAVELQTLKAECEVLAKTKNDYINTKSTQHDIDKLVQENTTLKELIENNKTTTLSEFELGPCCAMGVHYMEKANKSIKCLQEELIERRGHDRYFNCVIEENNKKIVHLEKILGERNELLRKKDMQIAQETNTKELEVLSLTHAKDQLNAKLSSLVCENTKTEDQLVATYQELEIMRRELLDKTTKLETLENHVSLDLEHREKKEMLKLKGKLEDYNNIKDQLTKCLENQKDFLSEIDNLRLNVARRDKKIEELRKKCNCKAIEIKSLEGKLKYTDHTLQETTERAEANLKGIEDLQQELKEATLRLTVYENHISKMDSGIEMQIVLMNKDREKEQSAKVQLEEEVVHMKNEIEGLRQSLEQSMKQISFMRKAEKELKKIHEDEKKNICLLKGVINKQKNALQEVKSLRKMMKEYKSKELHVTSEHMKYQESVAKHNEEMKTMMKLQDQHLHDLITELKSLDSEKQQSNKVLEFLNIKIATLEKEDVTLEQQLAVNGSIMDDLNSEYRMRIELEIRSQLLQQQIIDMEDKIHNKEVAQTKLEEELQNTKETLSNTQKELGNIYSQVQEEKITHASIIEEINRKSTAQMQHLLDTIKNIGITKNEVEISFLEEKKAKEQLEIEHGELSSKLLVAIRLAIEEKMALQITESQIEEFRSGQVTEAERIIQLTENINTLRLLVDELSCNLEKSKKEIEKITEEKMKLQQLTNGLNMEITQLRTQIKANKEKSNSDQEIVQELLAFKEDEINIGKRHIQQLEERMNRIIYDLNESRQTLLVQRQEEGKLHQEVLSLQAKNRELRLAHREIEAVNTSKISKFPDCPESESTL